MSDPATYSAAVDLGTEILRTLDVLRRGDPAPVEIRMLKTRQKTVSGYYTDLDALVRDLRPWDGKASIHLVLNPVVPDLLARSVNHLTPYAECTTADDEIQRRHWFLVDADPERPRGISATEAELARALACRDAIVRFLEALDFPEPLLARSGNGGHALVGVDLPNDATVTELLKRGLQALAARFDEPGRVVLDTSVYNAARITKLYGVIAVKGDATAERPHRRSRLESVPAVVQNVPRAALEALAAMAPASDAHGRTTWNGHGPTINLVAAFMARGWYRRPLGDGKHGVTCPWQSEHSGDSGPSETALYEPGADNGGAGGFKCQHMHCVGRSIKEVYALLRAEGEAPSGATVREVAPEPLAPWPVLAPEALYGLAGRIVETIAPASEADPVAILLHTLVAAGSLIGPGPHARVEQDRHPARLAAAMVGRTSKGRKGTGWSTPRAAVQAVDPAWTIASGLSSGEGLIFHVRDRVERADPETAELETVDEGVADKRLLVMETELATVLSRMGRDGNTLSSVLRDAWDHGNLRTLTKNSPLRATGAHVSIIGHITEEELRRLLTDISMANGFGNRFLWACVRRAQLLPDGAGVAASRLAPLVEDLRTAVGQARTIGQMTRDAEAAATWRDVYADLSRERDGLVGALLGRAEAQTLRLSCLYALLDRSPVICAPHLEAALAVWNYCEASVLYLFGHRLGHPIADAILDALRRAGRMTRTQIRDLFSRHKDTEQLQEALGMLERSGLVRRARRETGGRPEDSWEPAP